MIVSIVIYIQTILSTILLHYILNDCIKKSYKTQNCVKNIMRQFTLDLWERGKVLVRNATCIDSLAYHILFQNMSFPPHVGRNQDSCGVLGKRQAIHLLITSARYSASNVFWCHINTFFSYILMPHFVVFLNSER